MNSPNDALALNEINGFLKFETPSLKKRVKPEKCTKSWVVPSSEGC